MSDAAYFRQLADRCLKYSTGCFDLGASERFRHLAEEFAQEAIKRENEAKLHSLPARLRRWWMSHERLVTLMDWRKNLDWSKARIKIVLAAVKDLILTIGRETRRRFRERVKAISL
ncbi:MAG: hypothetical protein HY659_11450 [Rhizobiales bacterium]|nr:hypothetical protein [Hyphomicrobiales bacterium]